MLASRALPAQRTQQQHAPALRCAARPAARLAPARARGRMAAAAVTVAAGGASLPPLGYDTNFGAASSLDATVYGACRPGGPGEDGVDTPAGSLSDAAVSAWATHMAAAGITRVVSLLDDGELQAYATPLEAQYGKLFKRCAAALRGARPMI
jgi:hypothetical protein